MDMKKIRCEKCGSPVDEDGRAIYQSQTVGRITCHSDNCDNAIWVWGDDTEFLRCSCGAVVCEEHFRE